MAQNLEDLFAENVTVQGDCWLWAGSATFEGIDPAVWIWLRVHGTRYGERLLRTCGTAGCISPEHRVEGVGEVEITAPVKQHLHRQEAERFDEIRQRIAAGESTRQVASALSLRASEVLEELASEFLPRDASSEAVERHRRVQHERLELLIEAVLRDALYEGKSSARARASGVLLKALARQSKLFGLDAPEKRAVEHVGKVEVDMRDFSDQELQALRAKLRARIEAAEDEPQVAEVIQLGEWTEK